MSQPVRLGLVFPRSGQQLFIHVPLNITENSETRQGEFPRVEGGASQPENATEPTTDSSEHTA